MRVIAGSAGGIRLAVPKRGVRPTMDRVKAAIFSSLGDAIVGARVLDLFAGSGALGIEALSRGASSVVFVEADRQSAGMIEGNLAKTKLKGRLRQQDVFDFLRHGRGAEMFDIIFADPPYQKTEDGERFTEKLLANEALPQLVNPDGIFVLEKRPDENLPETRLWRVIRQKAYGATEVLFLCVSRAISREEPRMDSNQREVLKRLKAASSGRTPKRLRREKSAVRGSQSRNSDSKSRAREEFRC
jgi:16S rRNA (guanine966-N2)-methyltransferase